MPALSISCCVVQVQLLHELSISAKGKGVKLLKVIKNPVTQYLPTGYCSMPPFWLSPSARTIAITTTTTTITNTIIPIFIIVIVTITIIMIIITIIVTTTSTTTITIGFLPLHALGANFVNHLVD